MKILIVDDISDDRKLLRYIIENHGYEVIEAENGREGLLLAAAHRPDLIISDALMPVMDGFQFLKNLKKNEFLSSIPFVFYSAVYKKDKDVKLGLMLGAEAYIIKPKDPEELWPEIEKIIMEGKKGTTESDNLITEDEEYLNKYCENVALELEEKSRHLEKSRREYAALAEDLKESENKLRIITDASLDAIILGDNAGNIHFWNAGAAKMFGYSAEEVIGKDISILMPEKFRDVHHKAYSEFSKKGHGPIVGKTREVSALRKDGTEFSIELSVGSIMIEGRWHALGIIRDVTHRKKLETQLWHAQKLDALGTLTGGIAHDFNNILTAIIGYASMLDIRMPKDSPLKDNVTQIMAAADRAAVLTRGLLTFGRKQEMETVPVKVNDIMARVEKLMARIIGEDIEVQITPAPDDPLIMADINQIEQVLINLATNARDSMPKGGLITLSAASIDLDEEFSRVHGYGDPGSYVMLVFSDTGMGMDEKTRDRIFEPFFTTKEVGRGTGLGLSIVYGIIKQHRGYINCYSELGRGTTFRIYLPAVKRKEEMIEPVRIAPELVRGTETILLAEDDIAVRQLTTAILEDYGYTVIAATDGLDAVVKFNENMDKVQLLIMDVIMPKMNGREAYDEIQKLKPATKALFVSGYPADILKRRDVVYEGLDFLAKPITPGVLLKAIRELLDKR